MENLNLYKSDSSVYPGEYVPLLKEEEIQEELKQWDRDQIAPQVNITESPDSFKVEVAIPGAKREELLVHIDENILSISVLHQRASATDQVNFRLHEFDYNCFDRHITLPEQADAQFTSAEYFSGILHLHMQKTSHPVKSHHVPIVV
jgi:HSP20 family protein